MSMALSKFGFCGHILKAVLALYSCPAAQVFTTGMLSTPFCITNGTRQGCPPSLTIFNLMIEPLVEAIRTQTTISGFQFGSKPHVINLFADDVILLLTNPLTSLPPVHELLRNFGKISYCKVNFTKSLILNLGVPKTVSDKLQQSLPYSWSKNGIPYLGITLTSSTQSLADTNIKPLLAKLETQTKSIKKWELSWLGRLVAFKMSILPQLLYMFRALPIPIPAHYLKSLSSLMWKFLLGTKKAICSQTNLKQHKQVGGAGLVDICDYM